MRIPHSPDESGPLRCTAPQRVRYASASRGTLPPSLRGRPVTGHAASAAPTAAPCRPARTGQLRIADLFAGIGGFHLAFARTGARCVWASENNPVARTVYEANFRPHAHQLFEGGHFAGDITTVGTDTVPDYDVLTAGFPCQPFSDAGVRRGFADPRGSMFFEITRVISATQPEAFLLENVKGLATHHGGMTFHTIERFLARELGYSFHARVLRACDFGLPQLRPRLFMVGFRDRLVPFQFPEPVPLAITMDDIFGGDCERKIGRTLLASGHGKALGSRYNFDAYLVDGALRRIGPREAMAMQGFPADFMLPASDTQSLRLLGNSVAIPVIEAIGREITRSLRPGAFPAAVADGAVPLGQEGGGL